MLVIPASSGNTSRQIQLMRNFRTTMVHATPSYLLHLDAALALEGAGLDQLRLQKAFIGAEPHSEMVSAATYLVKVAVTVLAWSIVALQTCLRPG